MRSLSDNKTRRVWAGIDHESDCTKTDPQFNDNLTRGTRTCAIAWIDRKIVLSKSRFVIFVSDYRTGVNMTVKYELNIAELLYLICNCTMCILICKNYPENTNVDRWDDRGVRLSV